MRGILMHGFKDIKCLDFLKTELEAFSILFSK